jgi:hypothetical protein
VFRRARLVLKRNRLDPPGFPGSACHPRRQSRGRPRRGNLYDHVGSDAGKAAEGEHTVAFIDGKKLRMGHARGASSASELKFRFRVDAIKCVRPAPCHRCFLRE